MRTAQIQLFFRSAIRLFTINNKHVDMRSKGRAHTNKEQKAFTMRKPVEGCFGNSQSVVSRCFAVLYCPLEPLKKGTGPGLVENSGLGGKWQLFFFKYEGLLV
jgi:hypothetical protein